MEMHWRRGGNREDEDRENTRHAPSARDSLTHSHCACPVRLKPKIPNSNGELNRKRDLPRISLFVQCPGYNSTTK